MRGFALPRPDLEIASVFTSVSVELRQRNIRNTRTTRQQRRCQRQQQ